MEYGGYNVNEKYSPIVAPNFYFDSIFQPGLTYSDQFQGEAEGAGAVKVFQLAAKNPKHPKAPGTDFEHGKAENQLIPLLLNNSQQESTKIYNVQAEAVPYAMGDQHLSQSVQVCREGWQMSGLACLVHEGTLMSDVEPITESNIIKKVIAGRKVVRKNKASANVVLASVETYSTMLEIAGDKFTPVKNDEVVRTGQMGYYLGMLWIECNMLDLTTDAKYFDYTGTLQTEDLSQVEYIMYDWRGLHIVDLLDMARLKDSENFNGTLAQVEIVSGYRLGDENYAVVKKKAAKKELTVTSEAGTASGKTKITVEPTLGDGNGYKYKAAANPTVPEMGASCTTGYTAWDGTAEITATTGNKIVVVEVDANNKCVGAGIATVTSAA